MGRILAAGAESFQAIPLRKPDHQFNLLSINVLSNIKEERFDDPSRIGDENLWRLGRG